MKSIFLMFAAACAMSPVIAQDYHEPDPHQPWNDGSAAASQEVAPGAVAPGRDPGTRRLNGALAAQSDRDRIDHENDVRVYWAEQIDRGRVVAQQGREYARDRRRYEMSRRDWQRRDWACRNGDWDACAQRDPRLPYALYDPDEARH